MEGDDDTKIDEFLEKLNKEEYQSTESVKEISPQFSSLDDILDQMNEIQILFENPDLKFTNKIRNKISIVIPVKSNNEEDENFFKGIKSYKNIYEMNAQKINQLIDNIKENFVILGGSIRSLIKSVEKSKMEYFETIKLMLTPMTVQIEKLNKIEVNKFSKEKQLNYEDKKTNLDNDIKDYDKKLSKIIVEKKEILDNVKQNLLDYINLMNKLDGPINNFIEDIENIFNSFEEKGKKIINIIMNYTNPNEKQTAISEINELNHKIVSVINNIYLKLIENKNNIETQMKTCNNNLENIRQNNLPSSEKLTELQDQAKTIIKEINELLRFCWIKTKIPQINKDLKGFQLYDIKIKMDEGTKYIIKINEKLMSNVIELKSFIKQKDEELKKVFT